MTLPLDGQGTYQGKESSRRTAVVPPIKYEVTEEDMAQKLDEMRQG